MADSKISALTDGGAVQAGDEFVVARGVSDVKIAATQMLVTLFDSKLGADAASIDTGAAGIASGFAALLVLMQLRTDEAGAISNATITFNNDGGANYDWVAIQDNNSTVTGGQLTATTGVEGVVHGSGGSANYPSSIEIFIPNYDGTTFYKTGRMLSGVLDATAGNRFAIDREFAYRSTSAISRMAVAAAAGQKLKAGSRLTILGI